MFGCEAGLVSVSPNSTIDVESVEYAVKFTKWADIFRNSLNTIIRCKGGIAHVSYLQSLRRIDKTNSGPVREDRMFCY